MKRLGEVHFRQLIAMAPALLVPFGTGESRVIPREAIASVTSGVITLSPQAIFFQECQFVWQRFSVLAGKGGQ